jgi:hypothetical protein
MFQFVANDKQVIEKDRHVASLPLERPSRLAEVTLARKILSLSEGTIGEISALFSYAALDAIERGTEQITSNSLDECGYVSTRERRRGAAIACVQPNGANQGGTRWRTDLTKRTRL